MKKLFTSFLALALASATVANAADAPTWKAIGTGDHSTYGIKTDGTLWGWGSNEDAQLGVGPAFKFSTEPLQIGTDNTWKSVYGARGAMFCIKEDGSLWTAGSNEKGMSGVGDGVTKHTELTRIGTDNDWASVSTSITWCYTVLALKTDGSLWAWGSGADFQLGNGKTQSSAVPIRVGEDNDWKAVSVGASHVLALKNDGSMWGWGFASYGQLLNTDESIVRVPTKISDETWEAVYAIDNASYAVKTDGTLWAWGDNQLNILGLNDEMDDTDTDGNLPNVKEARQITALEGHVTAITGCQYVRVAIAGGKVYAWGANANGGLGNGKGEAYEVSNNQFSYTPVSVDLPEGFEPLTIASGQRYTVALDKNGSAYGWGTNRWGEMGNYVDDSNATFEPTPVLVGVPAPPKPGEYVIDATDIPSNLKTAVKLTLTGEWGTTEFGKLCNAIGANLGFPPVGNTTLVSVDMSAATIKPGTSMNVPAGMQNAGVFKMCKALESVRFPNNETVANIVDLSECFWNCENLTACDVSRLVNATNITRTFYNTSVSMVDMSAWNAVTKCEDAFGKNTKLTTVLLPAELTVSKYLFNTCTALRLIDWSNFAGETAQVVPETYKVFQDLTEEQQALITVMVPAAVYDSFKSQATWQYVNLKAVEQVEEGTYHISGSNIPSDLTDAVKIYLSGYWDTDCFKALSTAIGNNTGTSGNSVLRLVDMSEAEIAIATNLCAPFPGIFSNVTKGIFHSCKALETVVMPAADQAANFRSFETAFQLCEALTEIDLSGCTGLNNTKNTFYNDAALVKAVLPGNFSFAQGGTFDRCNALETIDWTLFEGTEAPAFKVNSVPARGKDLTIIVPEAAYDSFMADANWSKYNIVKAGTSGIDNIEASESGVRAVYKLSGVFVGNLQPGESASTLPAGLYIIGGRKVLVK